jgi:Ca-activated chloride channel homolog
LLTSHFDDFKQMLLEVGPHSVTRGGSHLGEAIKVAARAFLEKTNDHKTMVIFTDGEDQESKPLEVARQVFQENGIRVFTVGLGDLDHGAKIPEKEAGQEEFLKYRGEAVWTKLNGQLLREVATETGGVYIPAGTRQVNMSDVYHQYLAKIQQTEFDRAQINTFIARFQWFAAPALLLLILEVYLTTRRTIARREFGVPPFQKGTV